MSDKVQKIKQELEKRLSILWDLIPEGEKVLQDDFTKEDANNLGKYTELESLLKFIDSLPEEPVNKDLEEEITKCYKSRNDLMMTRKQFGELIHHFAEWQKERMMKDDVELTITNTSFIPLPKLDIKAGDKVKIIIVKEGCYGR